MFWGHLDAAGLALLPQTIVSLGMAIASPLDARTVSKFTLWSGLKLLSESMHVCYNGEFVFCIFFNIPRQIL